MRENLTEFRGTGNRTMRNSRSWFHFTGEGQNYLEIVHRQKEIHRVLIEREIQGFCRCNPDEEIRMTVAQRKSDTSSSATYTIKTVKGYRHLHYNDCENHVANNSENASEDDVPDKPVRPDIYGKERMVSLNTRGATQSGSAGAKKPDSQKGTVSAPRVETDRRCEKWARLIIAAAYYNVVLKNLLANRPSPKPAGIFFEIALNLKNWKFSSREKLADRLYLPFLKDAAGDCTTELHRKLTQIQTIGPGSEELLVIGEFGKTEREPWGGLRVSFPKHGQKAPDYPYVILPISEDQYTQASGEVLNRSPKEGVWHYAAATVGLSEGQMTVTSFVLIPFLRGNGALITSQADLTLSKMLLDKGIPFDTPNIHLLHYRKAWGSKYPNFVLLDRLGKDKAIVVTYGPHYRYLPDALIKKEKYFTDLCSEWGLDYLPWRLFDAKDIPDDILRYANTPLLR